MVGISTTRPACAAKGAVNFVALSNRRKIMTPLSISLRDIAFFGNGLNRFECVLCAAKGYIYCADWRGGVTRIDPNGRR